MDLGSELEAATTMAQGAGEILLSYFDTDRVSTRVKGHRDVVTAADLASERYLAQRLAETFPDDGLVAEEGSTSEAGSGRQWFVDPLDGTLNYSRGIPIFCVSIALVERNQPVVGVIHDPIRRETFGAVAGQGAWLNGVRISSSSVNELADAVIHLTVDFEEVSMREGIEDLTHLVPRIMRSRNTGSAALGLAYVAAGRLDAMLHRFAHTWDFAAGVLLVREAGGHVTAMSGTPYDASDSSVAAAATTNLHAELIEILRR
jgi:myo-inositol-1(or 4)-monophosphatase